MCEDLAQRRVTLNCILEACEFQHKASILPPPAKVIKQLVEEVFHESVSADILKQCVPVCRCFSFSADCCVSEFNPVFQLLNLKVQCATIFNMIELISLPLGGSGFSASQERSSEWQEPDDQREASW